VIYEILTTEEGAVGMLTPEERESCTGHAEIRQGTSSARRQHRRLYRHRRHIQRGSKIRLIRDGKIITEDLSIGNASA